MRVGVDIDGVLFDFYASWRLWVESLGVDCSRMQLVDGEPAHWHFYEDIGMTEAQFLNSYDSGVDAGQILRNVPPREGAAAAMQRLKDAGHTVHLVTDRQRGRPDASYRATKWWLKAHGVPYDTLTISADKTTVPVDVFIEDKFENYVALWQADTPCYLVERPWNSDGRAIWGYRAHSVTSAVERILHPMTIGVPGVTGEVRVTSASGAQKGTKPERFDLIPAEALAIVARHYGFGAKKYAPWNWRKGYEWSLTSAALERHLNAWKAGEDIDEESGSPHMAAIVFHALTLITYATEHPELDDRWPAVRDADAA